MDNVTSGLLSKNKVARYQLTANHFPVGKLAAHDDDDDDDGTKTGVSWSSSETDDGCPHSSDTSTSTRWNADDQQGPLIDGAGCWADGPPRHPDAHTAGGILIGMDDDVRGMERLAADSAVGRLVLMIQRLTDTNQRQLPAVSHLCQVTPPGPPMTTSVTHVGKSLSAIGSQSLQLVNSYPCRKFGGDNVFIPFVRLFVCL